MTAFGGDNIESLEVNSVRKLVYNQLKNMILTNRAMPGQQIVIDKLTKQFGVSQTPIREALNTLAAEGLVTIARYKNAVVSTINDQDVRDVYAMRILLEGWAVSEAIGKIPAQTLDDMEASILTAREEIERSNYDGFLEADIVLHDTITNTVENRLFTRILELIGNQSMRIRSLVEVTHPVETMHIILNEHCDIIAAIRANDPQLARQTMEAHLRAATDRTILALNNLPRD